MKKSKKLLSVFLAGVMVCAALAFVGCSSSDDTEDADGNTTEETEGTETEGTETEGTTESDLTIVGTWYLSAAYDSDGNQYDLTDVSADRVMLVVTDETTATFYYFDDDAFEGTLSRDEDRDDYYAVDGFTVATYDLTDEDGSYWEFCYVVSEDEDSVFIYIEIGSSDDMETIYLMK